MHYQSRPGAQRVPIRPTGADAVASLLAAATRSEDRSMKLAYLAQARVLLAEQLERHAQLQAHLDALEKEISRTEPAQLTLEKGSAK
jgi:hypothetical protein